MMRSRPNTEPCGTPHDKENGDDLRPETETMAERDERYDWNQESTEPVMPNQVVKRWRRMAWSMVSNAAERSNKHRQDTCCLAVARMRES